MGEGDKRQRLLPELTTLPQYTPSQEKKHARRHLLKGPRSQGLPLPGDRKRRYLGNEVAAAGGRLHSFFEIYILELEIILALTYVSNCIIQLFKLYTRIVIFYVPNQIGHIWIGC